MFTTKRIVASVASTEFEKKKSHANQQQQAKFTVERRYTKNQPLEINRVSPIDYPPKITYNLYMRIPVRHDAAARIAKLPEPIRKHVTLNDPYWCDLPLGWFDLVCEMNEKLEAIDPDYMLDQCKEKFGGLRYYAEASDGPNIDYVQFDLVISDYEDLSFKVCEVCGSEGKVSRSERGWISTRCKEHTNEGSAYDFSS